MTNLRDVADTLRTHAVTIVVAVIFFGGIALKMRDPWAATRVIPNEPVQGPIIESPASWPHEGAILTEVATWELEAVVLHKEWYRLDHFASVVPLDLALGWGPMSDPDVLGDLRVSQRNRWYWVYWSNDMAHSEETLMASSSNVHILPATPDVLRTLRSFGQGDNVYLRGRLVDVSLDGGEMRTSRSREDRGGGACEVFFVEEARRL